MVSVATAHTRETENREKSTTDIDVTPRLGMLLEFERLPVVFGEGHG
jgi:hypothetical protein